MELDEDGNTFNSSIDGLQILEECIELAITDLYKAADVRTFILLEEKHVMKLNKSDLARFTVNLLRQCERSQTMIKKTKKYVDDQKSYRISSQEDKIKLQQELISSQKEEIKSVQNTVKQEFRSWSDVVAEKCSPSAVTSEKLKEAVKSAVSEEDRSKNLMIFGQSEKANEDVCSTVSEMFEYLEEKPKVSECSRVGKHTKDKDRPIRVTLSSRDAVNNILRKSKKLKNNEVMRHVYVTADRSLAERADHKLLVAELKKLIVEKPDKYHFIRNNKVCSIDKT